MGDVAEAVIQKYIHDFVGNNQAARLIQHELGRIGMGLRPLVDHITVRTLDLEKRSKEFLRLGFTWDRSLGRRGVIGYDDWWAKVYRKPGLPAVFIDQAFMGPRGRTSVIPPWVERFSDRILHHLAVLVEDIEEAVRMLRRRGVRFAGSIVGARREDLRQVFTAADEKKGYPFTVVEIIERHRGYAGFQPPHANRLMKSSLITSRTSR